IITSMRLIADVDWTELFERVSLVDEVFKAGSRFQAMDFPTRNLYRDAVEQLARGSRLTELEVAQAAVETAARAPHPGGGVEAARRSDPGYCLVAGGRPAFERAIGFRAHPKAWPGRTYRALGIGGYVSLGALVAAVLLAVPLSIMAASGLRWPWVLALAVTGVVPAIDVAVALVNHIVTQGFRATLLPALELREGVPPHLRTLVAVPTLLTTRASVEEHIARLEIHYLASAQGDVHYALLSDWTDAPDEHAAGDDDLLKAAREGIERLNERHAPARGGPRFLLLHRRRVWNASERCWMGWERKRGKLCELNRLLRDAGDTTFMDPPAVPANVRFVITLDGDTKLPRETVGRLIGKMAHPLNRPRLDERLYRVVEGYAVLQPRVTPAMPVGREGSLFLRVFSRATGIDPYAAAVSDVYQDLFGEGSYTGKGIYDVDAFEAALAGRVPDCTLLSHDLFEGIFARAGLASDVEVVEEFPARYDTAALRHHRWARGDWQLLPWIFGRGPKAAERRPRGGVPAIGRWKMLDNLRRSVSSPALIVTLIVGWALPLGDAVLWTAFIVATMALPPLIPVAADIPRRRPGVTLASHARALGSELRLALVQCGLMIVFLAHQAWLMGDAIARTLVRMTITRRRLLQWVPSELARFGAGPSVAGFYANMAGALAVGGGGGAAAGLPGEGPRARGPPFRGARVATPRGG
ncbi:MAG: glycosyl transferase, partial [Caulobacterales bacterium]